ncbi:MAG TPA: hypothetical protein VFQ44_06450 [Streptosporangiaceae bacterium]|nr:hypothetical protein [Streptosporangiaceae bacterium]
MSNFLHRLGFGLTGRNLITLLEDEKPQAVGDPAAEVAARPPKNAEKSVVVSIVDSLASRDRRQAAALLRKQQALVRASHARINAMRRLSAAQAHPRLANEGTAQAAGTSPAGTSPAGDSPAGTSPAGDSPAGDSPDDRLRFARRWRRARPAGGHGTFREMFDPHSPLIAERALLAIEAVFVAVEFVFWYGVFALNVDAHASALDPTRISDILLSVMIPLSGIVAARIIGGLAHRVMRKYPGTGRIEYVGAVVSAAVAGLAIVAIFMVIHARFDQHAPGEIGAFEPPALAMTLVFIVVLAGDMIARIFLVSEVRKQTEKRHRHIDKLATRATGANRKHASAWLDLRNAVQRQLDTDERVVAAGARIISDDRARSGTASPSLPEATAGIREAHALNGQHAPSEHAPSNDATASHMAVPSLDLLQLLGVNLAPVRPRVIADAVDTLREWPSLRQAELASHVGGMAERLYPFPPANSRSEEAAQPSGPVAGGPGFRPIELPKRHGPKDQNGGGHQASHNDADGKDGL